MTTIFPSLRIYFCASGPSSSRARTGLDSPYVVQFHNCRVLAKAEELFTVRFLLSFYCVASRWKYVFERTLYLLFASPSIHISSFSVLDATFVSHVTYHLDEIFLTLLILYYILFIIKFTLNSFLTLVASPQI